MPSDSLTRRESEVLGFVRDTIRETRMPPTIREIARRLGNEKSTGNVHRILTSLKAKGFIHSDDLNIIVELDGSGDAVIGSALTRLQASVYEYLIQKKGEDVSPHTVRSITEGLNKSGGERFLPSSVHQALKALAKEHLIVLDAGRAGIALTAPHRAEFYITAVMKLPANVIDLTFMGENPEMRQLPLGEIIPGFTKADADHYFAVELQKGHGLWWFSIDDFILCEKSRSAHDGDLVVYQYEGKVSVGFFYADPQRPRYVIQARRLSPNELADWRSPDPEHHALFSPSVGGSEFYGEPDIRGVAVTAIINVQNGKLR